MQTTAACHVMHCRPIGNPPALSDFPMHSCARKALKIKGEKSHRNDPELINEHTISLTNQGALLAPRGAFWARRVHVI